MMMQPLDTCDEQEVMFFEDLDNDDDDDPNDGVPLNRSSDDITKTIHRGGQRTSINSNQIEHFQPLEQNTDEAVRATMRLESFLSANDDDPTNNDIRTNLIDLNVTRITHAETTTDNAEKTTLNVTNFIDVTAPVVVVVANNNIKITSTNKNIHPIHSFDPYAPQRSINTDPINRSLFDYEEEEEDAEIITATSSIQSGSLLLSSEQTVAPIHNIFPKTPGTVGFLEMEEEPPRTPKIYPKQQNNSIYDPIQTSSGLLLTHRRIPPPTTPSATIPIQTRFEVEQGTSSKNPRGYNSRVQSHLYPFSLYHNPIGGGYNPQSMFPASSITSILRYVKLWVILSAVILLSGTVVLIHHTIQTTDSNNNNIETTNQNSKDTDLSIQYDEESGIFHLNNENIQLIPLINEDTTDTEQIILLPLPETNNNDHDNSNNNHFVRKPRHRRLEQEKSKPQKMVGVPALIDDNNQDRTTHTYHKSHPLFERTLHSVHKLRADFDTWKVRHNKSYATEQEHQHRFQIWSHNHYTTIEKNERHGPCALTGQNVFGSSHFQDMTSEEFKSQYLNAYYLQREPINKGTTTPEQIVLGVHVDEPPVYHPIVHERLMQQVQQNSIQLDYQGCKWYDVSCILRYIFSTFLYGLGGTMEPAYDANSYPTCKSNQSFFFLVYFVEIIYQRISMENLIRGCYAFFETLL
jgi:hypothetical protein